jgi:hypothetical protein
VVAAAFAGQRRTILPASFQPPQALLVAGAPAMVLQAQLAAS